MKFDDAISFVLKWEGGYINDPLDPGGETNFGISKRAFPSVDIKHLTKDLAKVIYKIHFWDAYSCERLASPLCVVAFDSFVQHNPKLVRQFIDASLPNYWKNILALRRIYYLGLIKKNPALGRFRKGWFNRMNDLSKYCSILEGMEK